LPSTEATDQPRKTKVMARPRWGRRHQGPDAGRRLGREDGRRDQANDAPPQQLLEAGGHGGQRVEKRIPQQAADQQAPAVPARDHGGQQRGAQAHGGGAIADQVAGGADRDREVVADVVEQTGDHHHAHADHDVAEHHRPQHGRQTLGTGHGFYRRTCKAPGLTMLVGVPLMKLTTLSKAAPK
jgi:hypothetical protein